MNPMQWPARLTETTLTADAEAIRLYAEITNDFNPLHVNADFAAKTPFGRPIAHGTMSLALVWEAIGATFGDAARPGKAEIRFSAPVREGDVVTARGELVDADRGRYAFEVRNQEDSVALSGWVEIATT
jgi:3-hydroxybutyryl-CoA dehydratase